MEYTAQNLEYAVSVFYNGEQAERSKAHFWLTTAQRAPEAWNFVWELMQPTKGTEIQFYAATTLHTKILRCWNEVPPESYEELKEKLLQAVMSYSKGPIIVTNRLCISLAAFILQQGSKDLAEILRPLSTPENSSLLLEVLTVIPEEFNSMTMGTVLRAKNRAALNQASHMILDDMLRCLQSAFDDYSKEPPNEATIQIWTNAATCAGSWLTLGGEDSLENGATTLPERAPLCRALQTAVHVLYTWSSRCSEGAVEACEACLMSVRAAGTAGGAERYPAAALQLLAELAELAAQVLAPPTNDDAPDWINEELVTALVTCCVATCECHARTLVHAVEEAGRGAEGGATGGGATRLLQLLLEAQAAPGHYPLHETRSNLLFGLWYTLQDEILNMTDGKNKINPIWRDVFTQLLLALIKKSEMPAESALSRDDQELVRCYRQDISDAVMYCFSILGERCWEVTEGAFTRAESEAGREAALHVFVSLADAAPHSRAPPALSALLQHALRLAAAPHVNVRALATALDCLGSYASWLGSLEGEGGALAGACVRAAGAALPHSPAAAALALRKLCADCSASAAALAGDIVQVAQNVEAWRDAWTRRQLLSAAGAALAAGELARSAPLLNVLADQLRAELTTQAQTRTGAAGAESCAALMCALSPAPALAAELFRALLPALVLLPRQEHLVEPMFNILKHTLSSLLGECTPLINEIGELTVAGFNAYPCPAGLDVVKLIVLLHEGEWGGACSVTRACVCAAARVLASDAEAAPDLADALYTLLLALTRKKPLTLDWIDPVLSDLVHLACQCVGAWEMGGANAACGWLAALAARRASALRSRAPALTHQALASIGRGVPRAQLEALAELLLALNRAQWAEQGSGGGARADAEGLGTWLHAALEPAGFPTAHATPAHKNKFLTNVLKERSSKRRLLETVQEFSLACRGLIDTEYARQTIAARQIVA